MDLDLWHMTRALELARRGEGLVEPNPMVGCAIAQAGEVVGEGWHRRFGGPHAEVEALRIAGPRAKGATLYVTLEPCRHFGKTPPCTQAILAAGVRRVVCAMRDPFPAASGRGIAELQAAGVLVEVGLLEADAVRLNAPYLKLLSRGRPWIIAKWAMTLDGRMATRAGDSRWISGEESRAIVHQLRGRVDAIVIGSGTAQIDDPLLTARPPGPRTAARIVMDSQCTLSNTSQLIRTAAEAPVIVTAGPDSDAADRQRLGESGVEVVLCDAATHTDRLGQLLDELGRRRMTNVLVEGGSRLLGLFFDTRAIDELHVFIAPKLFGGAGARVPLAGAGIDKMTDAMALADAEWRRTGEDMYLRARIAN
ncbi:MAG TPA: bifunctional diaminohydroxyphosphoribosylaminopyrimidine deaminase/5-amino-6-(5-phosphoribosylamino)uracil reductase RibD [Pirellulales bacterium]|jgi:diaminohydroxyphosphoribosylaminopyrimidine deaminase/5-amino-6-(5-phosphoribosylamino)uracil reductase|nr:bifunctional diaminohydroxyphosphoribosylaminopyrimidine deaminase/5-amino-6-(5-phosphoribosylamino)uracil reductase RibD [Pirellulales bacterium]